jgi:phosphoribosylformylglycinamidine synthase
MAEVQRFAAAGGPVLGICNGFQVLLEAGLLPGAMLRNAGLRFRCEHVHVKVEHTDTPFTAACTAGRVLRIPIAHGEGNYYAEPDVLERLERNRQVIFRYVTADGEVTPDANPNGSIASIAGICNDARNVVGLMPHPERACELAVGSADGLVLLESAVAAVTRRNDVVASGTAAGR